MLSIHICDSFCYFYAISFPSEIYKDYWSLFLVFACLLLEVSLSGGVPSEEGHILAVL